MPVLTFHSIFRRRRPSLSARAPGAQRLLLLLLLAVMLPALLGLAPPVTLRGSRASVDRAHDWALARRLAFQPSKAATERAARAGVYTRLRGGYRLVDVSLPYALPATARWVAALAPRYQQACRQSLVVTSAIRTTGRRLFNGSELSVHPTGLAVDLRSPRGRCRAWLRTTLLAMERRGTIDATEERFPAHFHVVVFGPRAAPIRRAPAKPARVKPAPVKPVEPAPGATVAPAAVAPGGTPSVATPQTALPTRQ